MLGAFTTVTGPDAEDVAVAVDADTAAGSCSTVVSVVIWRLSLDQQVRRHLYSPARAADRKIGP
ncbi:hypothetical protein [Dactylosporangium roseum]|uniref:hypothetical protein n=1 Tax=Dactylosporangium roseum TaxID=47989 RepID=UPI0021B2715E|nr:hypothetical protein [Dactylosporangium roseum]